MENSIEHRLGESSGKSILLAGMERPEKCEVLRQRVFHPVTKDGFMLKRVSPQFPESVGGRVESDLSEPDDDCHIAEEAEFADKKGAAIQDFGREEFILRRSASACRSNVTILQS